jgi:predicted N-formylglutamate amidohydrolase
LTSAPGFDVAEWPEPVEILNEAGRSEIVLICEHASNYIPASFDGLGLPDEELVRHIAWDIGVEAVSRRMSELLDAACFLGKYSRLLIDLNRPLDSPTSIPVRSESTAIPGNIGMTDESRQVRIERIFRPFQSAVKRHLDQRLADGRSTKIVAIHSFTPVFLGISRPWHAGILFDRSAEFAERTIGLLSGEPGLTVAANVPYVIERSSDYAIPIHGQDRGLEAILIELRNDLLATSAAQHEWAERLYRALG